ncbi:unnamed protein product [Dovyalis caffra]|uniref:Uncharacterized protein n=1 Tax=Dovyalis caffra TaxID=77055 RepID=A0AAV1RRX8_9ROSI|nr:unnamed protein product [Dovyalis caffra]
MATGKKGGHFGARAKACKSVRGMCVGECKGTCGRPKAHKLLMQRGGKLEISCVIWVIGKVKARKGGGLTRRTYNRDRERSASSLR